MITLDDTDQIYVANTLTHCIAILKVRMTDPHVCEANRNRAIEFHKMAIKARNIINGRSEQYSRGNATGETPVAPEGKSHENHA